MSISPKIFVMLFFTTGLSAGPCLTDELPPEILTLGKITIGTAKLADISTEYGFAIETRVDRTDESDLQLCYVFESDDGSAIVSFFSGTMGSEATVTGFKIAKSGPKNECTTTKPSTGEIKTGNGVKLGMTLAAFKRATMLDFVQKGQELRYLNVSHRAVALHEAGQLSSVESDQDYFDITVSIIARFRKNQLVEYSVKRIESN